MSDRLRLGRRTCHVERFLARQPIFNSERAVFGYELLFRSGPGIFFDGSHPDVAAASTVDNMFALRARPVDSKAAVLLLIAREISWLRDFALTCCRKIAWYSKFSNRLKPDHEIVRRVPPPEAMSAISWRSTIFGRLPHWQPLVPSSLHSSRSTCWRLPQPEQERLRKSIRLRKSSSSLQRKWNPTKIFQPGTLGSAILLFSGIFF